MCSEHGACVEVVVVAGDGEGMFVFASLCILYIGTSVVHVWGFRRSVPAASMIHKRLSTFECACVGGKYGVTVESISDGGSIGTAWHPCWTVGIYASANTKENEVSSLNSAERASNNNDVIDSESDGDGGVRRQSAGKFSKYAPSKERADAMSSEEFRKSIYDTMVQEQEKRKRRQGGKVGAQVSNEYFDQLNQETRVREVHGTTKRSNGKRKYGLNSQESWK